MSEDKEKRTYRRSVTKKKAAPKGKIKDGYWDADTQMIRRSHPDEPQLKLTEDERRYWRIMELIPDTREYSSYDRLDVLAAYAACGNMMKVSEMPAFKHIPYQTMMYWKGTEWWKPAIREIRSMMDDEMDGRITALMNRALEEMEDRLENGDEKVTKDGDTVKVKVSFRDLAIAGVGVLGDKRALMRGEPTARVEHVDDRERLAALEQQFRKIARQDERVINGTFERVDKK